MSGVLNLLSWILLAVVLLDCPVVVHVQKLAYQLINCILRLHLDIHGDEECKEEENSTRQCHQLAWGELRVGADRLRLTISILFEAENGDARAGDHEGDGEEEDGVQHLVPGGARREQALAQQEAFLPEILKLTKLAAGRIRVLS